MKVQHMPTKLLLLVLVAIAALGWAMSPRSADAIDTTDERPSPMMGIARGQTARLNVVGYEGPDMRPCVATLLFYNSRGTVLAQDAMTLGPGRAAFLDLSYAAIGDPNVRSEIRAKVIGDPNLCRASLEVFDDATGKSTLIITQPWAAR